MKKENNTIKSITIPTSSQTALNTPTQKNKTATSIQNQSTKYSQQTILNSKLTKQRIQPQTNNQHQQLPSQSNHHKTTNKYNPTNIKPTKLKSTNSQL